MQQGGLVKALQADSGTQTLSLSSGGTIAQTIPHIDIYELSSAGQLLPIKIKLGDLLVSNDIQQQLTLATNQPSPALTIKGSSGADVIRTAAVDVVRGGLVVDLAGDTAVDYVFVNNSRIGNEGFSGALATNGFGGRVATYSVNPDVYANGSAIGDTALIWRNLNSNSLTQNGTYSAGIRAATYNGFQVATDVVVYLEGVDSTAVRGGFFELSAVPATGGFIPPTNSVIEIQSGFLSSAGITPAAFGSDPKNLENVARLLDNIPDFEDNGGSRFYVVLYDYAKETNADAWLYAATATQGDGFDFADGKPANVARDTDTLELIAIFKGVGVNAFTTDNFL
jgi:hypothetical protein